MSELKWKWAYGPYLDPPEGQEESAIKAGYVKVVSKQSADEVVAELKQKLDKAIAERDGNQVCIDALKAEIKRKEGVGQRWFERCMEERTENIRLRRALYKACANWAIWRASVLEYFCIKINAKKWERMYHRCLEKAEEYK